MLSTLQKTQSFGIPIFESPAAHFSESKGYIGDAHGGPARFTVARDFLAVQIGMQKRVCRLKAHLSAAGMRRAGKEDAVGGFQAIFADRGNRHTRRDYMQIPVVRQLFRQQPDLIFDGHKMACRRIGETVVV